MKILISAPATALLLCVGQAFAQMEGHMHERMMGGSMAPDERQMLDFPPPMREHMLTNMRGHFVSLQEILTALAAGDGPRAAKIARERLGVDSPGAAACVKPKDTASHPGEMDHMSHMAMMMAQHMPEEMRAMGLAMHELASAFAAEAEKAPAGSDMRPALAALAQVTQNCAACHAAYRLR